ncbi:hypothetical protein [Microvirga tunisiensis]|uniref:hypothetical protein n=1 Tax=Microvirga tunisiensis TaxID=2108360 RepID=UPI00128CFCB1|nr:hypothetical protein [Microvirga tunisiensis]MPR09162.1 hypothetical protein [Microvirga tunisiensis]
MATFLRASGNRQVLFAAAWLGLSLSADAALANDPTHGPAPEIATTSAGPATDRSGRAKAPARNPTRTPEGAGNFVYGLINTIRAQSEELCARYGNPSDCLEEAEVCLTMRDTADNTVRLCLNTTPGESDGDKGTVQKSRVRRSSR